MTETPRDFVGALGYAWAQHAHLAVPSYYHRSTWEGLCQAFCHEAYGLHTGGFASAWLQFLGADASDRHLTSNFDNAPAGALLCTKGSTPFGHIFPAKKRPFRDGTPAAMSTDLWRTGLVGPVSRNAAHLKWGHTNKGWITSINGYALDLTHGTPPKPKQNKKYQRIERAINNLEVSKTAAEHDHDAADLAAINGEIKRLENLYAKLRHA